MSWERIALGFLCAMMLCARSPARAGDDKIVLDGKFGQVISNVVSRPGGPDNLELGQEVRVDNLTSADPDWDGATVTVYEQNLTYPLHGSYRSYGLLRTKAGDVGYFELAGTWNVVTKDGKFLAAPFEATGKLTGGSGKLEGVSGAVVVKGKVDREEVGTYSAEITRNR